MQMSKIFVGPKLRRLRIDRGQTQAQMGRDLGISTSYVNLLEKNERAVSASVLLKLLETYGVDWREIAQDDETARFADLRGALADPLFEEIRPDATQLRAALSHSPDLAAAFMRLHRAYMSTTDQLMSLAEASEGENALLTLSPETVVHTYFRTTLNHLPALEAPATPVWDRSAPPSD